MLFQQERTDCISFQFILVSNESTCSKKLSGINEVHSERVSFAKVNFEHLADSTIHSQQTYLLYTFLCNMYMWFYHSAQNKLYTSFPMSNEAKIINFTYAPKDTKPDEIYISLFMTMMHLHSRKDRFLLSSIHACFVPDYSTKPLDY